MEIRSLLDLVLPLVSWIKTASHYERNRFLKGLEIGCLEATLLCIVLVCCSKETKDYLSAISEDHCSPVISMMEIKHWPGMPSKF